MVNNDSEAAGVAIEEAEVLANAEIAALAVPNCNIVYIPATDAEDDVDTYFEIFMGMDPASIGGAKPDESFYYEPE
jgi:NitT/TauT family transport system substrate-binding protein